MNGVLLEDAVSVLQASRLLKCDVCHASLASHWHVFPVLDYNDMTPYESGRHSVCTA